MKTIGVHELTEHINKILRLVEENGETFEIIDQGKVIARIVPAGEPEASAKRDLTPFWEKIDRLAAEIGSYLPEKVDAVEIVRDGRREL